MLLIRWMQRKNGAIPEISYLPKYILQNSNSLTIHFKILREHLLKTQS
ncbi:hypothetical protein SAMN04488519_105367 [Algoriphagus ornithinivorans]|uniref:Uncharacterized protein n=1 Tax=Algoriphagus ornithinivorans TaxID=226506 RepID=A0A1I5GGB2_9BACT|nr:hypothetical protein SAMN04488519_105367 [Algoriphagus ornithinivorans]